MVLLPALSWGTPFHSYKSGCSFKGWMLLIQPLASTCLSTFLTSLQPLLIQFSGIKLNRETESDREKPIIFSVCNFSYKFSWIHLYANSENHKYFKTHICRLIMVKKEIWWRFVQEIGHLFLKKDLTREILPSIFSPGSQMEKKTGSKQVHKNWRFYEKLGYWFTN